MSILAPYLFFVRTTWRNRLLQFGRRIRTPRYGIALLVGVVYFFFAFGGPTLFDGRDAPAGGGGLIGMADTVGPLMLLLLAALWWFHKSMGQTLSFTPAEANLLVPAPLSRRQLIQFKLLNAVPGVLLTSLMFTAITRDAQLPAAARFISLVVLFGTLRLHQTAANLVRASFADQGRTGARYAWPAAVVFGAIVVTVMGSLFAQRDSITGATGTRQAMQSVAAILDQAPASYALAPFNAVLAPVSSSSLEAWPLPLGIALLILVAHYFWVLRMDAAFEEGAVEAGAQLASRVEAVRQGKRISLGASPRKVRAAWFPLESAGEPVYAVWWKNMLQVTRETSPVMLVLIIGVPVFFVGMDARSSGSDGLALVGAIMISTLALMASVMGPQIMRNDLRGDLRRIELLRTLPIGGGRLVAAEVAASTFTLTAIQIILFAIAAGLAAYAGRISMPLLAYAGVIPAVLLLLALNGTMVLIHNGFALYFPAWANLKRGQAPGVENFGQNILVMLGTILLFVLSLVGPVIVAALSGGYFALKLGGWAAYPAGFMFIVALYVQAAGIISWLGRVYDRMDPVEAGLCD